MRITRTGTNRITRAYARCNRALASCESALTRWLVVRPAMRRCGLVRFALQRRVRRSCVATYAPAARETRRVERRSLARIIHHDVSVDPFPLAALAAASGV